MTRALALAGAMLAAGALAAAALVAGAGRAAAEEGDFVPEIPLTARTGVGARSLSMGGTGVATAADLSAVDLNPAALALVRRPEVSLTMARRSLTVEAVVAGGATVTSDLSKLRLNAFGGAYPVRTYRGSLVLAAQVARPRLLDRDVRRTLAGAGRREFEFERGGPLDWRGGLAVLVAPNLALGGSLALLTGRDERIFTQIAGDTTLTIRDESSLLGWTGSVGALATAGDHARFGVVLRFPERYDFDGTQHVRSEIGSSDTTSTVTFVDEVDLPFSIALGGALTLPGVVLTGELATTDWREIDFAGPLRIGGEEAYRSVVDWRLGAEWYLPWAPLAVRAGYLREPLAYLLLPDFGGDPSRTIFASIDDDRAFWTAGAGTVVAGQVALDLGIVHGGFKRSTGAYAEETRETRLLVTAAYRI